MTVCPCACNASTIDADSVRSIPFSSMSCALPSNTASPAIDPRTPLPLNDSKSFTSCSATPSALARSVIACASGCSERFSRLAAYPSTRPCNANDSDDDLQTRFAFGQRAGLVDNERIDLFHELQRFGVLDQYAF